VGLVIDIIIIVKNQVLKKIVLFYVIYRAKFGTGPSVSQKISQPVIVPSNVMVFDFLSF
jgi:hypothetical protein